MTNNQYRKCGWPYFKITPSPTTAKTNELLIIAECVPNVYANFYQDFIKEKNSDLICPKLDETNQCVQRLANIIKTTSLEKITIIRMEDNCCGYLSKLVQKALHITNKQIPLSEKVINNKGKLQ
jgi:hypothetical protein